VTIAAGHLQDLGLICYSRGRITITDRKGLEGMVCECYESVETRVSRVMAKQSLGQFHSRAV